jgi:hypothetical protein
MWWKNGFLIVHEKVPQHHVPSSPLHSDVTKYIPGRTRLQHCRRMMMPCAAVFAVSVSVFLLRFRKFVVEFP